VKKFILLTILLYINILTQNILGYDNTQIIASNYCNATDVSFYEIALPHPNVKRNWVKIYYNNKIAIVQVLDVGPQNEYDNYWDAGTDNSGYNKRWMFQNLEQWMPDKKLSIKNYQFSIKEKQMKIKKT